MSNEHHDRVELRGSVIGLDALHGLAPDEILMAAEECRDAVEVEREASRDECFMSVTTNAFAGRPELEEAGYRLWIMGLRVHARLPRPNARERREMMRIATRCHAALRVQPCALAASVMEWICGGEASPWRMGRRASLLAYAFNRGPVVRAALPSFEKIGELWGLTAANKRSAVSAAMNALRAELVRSAGMPAGFRFWFEKSPEARAVYAEVQMGNTNRAGHAEHEAEEPGSGARTPEMRRRFERMHAAAELRRLEGIAMGKDEGSKMKDERAVG
jgi:hypothetical protein